MLMYSGITDRNLVIEAIRRTRVHKTPLANSNYEGSRVERVIELLNDWITAENLTLVCNQMMQDGQLTTTGWLIKHVPNELRSSSREFGKLKQFHPDVPLCRHYQHFSEVGTPLRSRKMNGKLIVQSKGKPYWTRSYKMFYLTYDGIPDNIPKHYV